MSMSCVSLLMWIFKVVQTIMPPQGKNVGRRMSFLLCSWTGGRPTVTAIKAHSLVLTICFCLCPCHIPLLLALCSVGLSLYLQSRFLYTFDNQIIYVIKKYKQKYIYQPVREWSSYEFLHVGFVDGFLEECISLAVLNLLVNLYWSM